MGLWKKHVSLMAWFLGKLAVQIPRVLHPRSWRYIHEVEAWHSFTPEKWGCKENGSGLLPFLGRFFKVVLAVRLLGWGKKSSWTNHSFTGIWNLDIDMILKEICTNWELVDLHSRSVLCLSGIICNSFSESRNPGINQPVEERRTPHVCRLFWTSCSCSDKWRRGAWGGFGFVGKGSLAIPLKPWLVIAILEDLQWMKKR